MKSTYYFFIIVLVSTTLASCRYWRKPLTLQKQPYSSLGLRTDGIFYNKNYGNFFLYRNGVILNGGTGWYSFEGLIKDCQKPEYNKYLNVAYRWGLFEIKYPNITIEQWKDGNVGEQYNLVQYRGIIVNDTTIFLSNYPTGRDTFHFYPLLVKPDSTNQFIK